MPLSVTQYLDRTSPGCRLSVLYIWGCECQTFQQRQILAPTICSTVVKWRLPICRSKMVCSLQHPVALASLRLIRGGFVCPDNPCQVKFLRWHHCHLLSYLTCSYKSTMEGALVAVTNTSCVSNEYSEGLIIILSSGIRTLPESPVSTVSFTIFHN